jgi:hypothetical protein
MGVKGSLGAGKGRQDSEMAKEEQGRERTDESRAATAPEGKCGYFWGHGTDPVKEA